MSVENSSKLHIHVHKHFKLHSNKIITTRSTVLSCVLYVVILGPLVNGLTRIKGLQCMRIGIHRGQSNGFIHETIFTKINFEKNTYFPRWWLHFAAFVCGFSGCSRNVFRRFCCCAFRTGDDSKMCDEWEMNSFLLHQSLLESIGKMRLLRFHLVLVRVSRGEKTFRKNNVTVSKCGSGSTATAAAVATRNTVPQIYSMTEENRKFTIVFPARRFHYFRVFFRSAAHRCSN